MLRSHVLTQGTGTPVVLIHGVGLDHAMWDSISGILASRFLVVRYDLIGHGKTSAISEPLTLEHFTQQLSQVMGQCGIERTALVGFSLGALIAQAFVLAHPQRVSRLVLLNGAYARNPDQQAGILSRLRQVEEHGVGSNVEASIARWFSDEFRRRNAAQVGLVEARLRNNDYNGFLAAYRLFAESDTKFVGRLSAIKMPTLVVTGEHDAGSTPAMSQAIAGEIDGAELQIFPNVKHMLPVENADRLGNELIRFLSEE